MNKGRISVNDTTTDTPVATGGKDKGFTLIELLIVIVILGVLATVTVFAVRGIADRGSDNACKADKKTLETAIESYFANNSVSEIPDGDDPTTTAVVETTPEGELVSAELLRSQSSKYNVTATGGLTVQDTACTGI